MSIKGFITTIKDKVSEISNKMEESKKQKEFDEYERAKKEIIENEQKLKRIRTINKNEDLKEKIRKSQSKKNKKKSVSLFDSSSMTDNSFQDTIFGGGKI
jgi:predicted nuclease with TOPRIM domain